MHCYDTLATIEGGTGACVALGYFDGVHLGHRRVLARTVEAARERGCTSAVFTFAPPLDRAVKGRAILTPEEKARRIAAMGVEHYVRPPSAGITSRSAAARRAMWTCCAVCARPREFRWRSCPWYSGRARLFHRPASAPAWRRAMWKLRAPCWGSLTASTFPYVTASGWGLRWAFPPSTRSIPIGCCFPGRAYM